MENAQLQLPSRPAATINRTPRSHPCVLCQQRKVKCDRKEPCSNCLRSRVNCISAAPIGPRKRKKRFPEAELLARLRRYEELLKGFGVNIDEINGAAEASGDGVVKTPSGSAPVIKSSDATTPDHAESASYNGGISEEFRDTEEILQGSSDDEDLEAPIMSTYDRSYPADGSELLFGLRPQDTSLTSHHPLPVHIFRLWQTFLDNMNPLCRLFHAPTVQQQILQASANLESVSKSMEALMFGIYYFAVTSLKEEECQSSFQANRASLLVRYQFGAQQSLLNAAFLKTSDIVVLQALTLYLISALHVVDPRSLFCLSGIAVRIGQRIGLDKDGAGHGISPFDVEMRRRLWWQIALLDQRVAELTGANSSIMLQFWNTKFPLNVNDSDLYPNMRDPPVESTGLTEMVFCLLRCEIEDFLRRFKPGSGLEIKESALDDFREHIETKYLKHCDPLIPLHLISILMGRSGINKMRLMYHRSRVFPKRSTTEPEHHLVFASAIEMLEWHNILLSSKATQRFLWYINKNFPFPAYVYLLCELRTRPVDELADRAWLAVTESSVRRMEHNFMRKESPLHIAICNLTIKAWEARESALQGTNSSVPVPQLIYHLRHELGGIKSKVKRTSSIDMSIGAGATGVEQQFVALHQRFRPDQPDAYTNPSFLSDVGMMDPIDAPPMNWDFWNGLMEGNDMDGLDIGGQPNTMYNYKDLY